jgi:hypothetical protein
MAWKFPVVDDAKIVSYCDTIMASHISGRNSIRACMSQELLKLLCGLGANPQDIAAKLGAEGIMGQRGSPSFNNPIARHISRHLNVGGLIYLPVPTGLLSVVREGNCSTVQLPKPIAHFLDAFHAGEFPQLEE